VTLKTKLLLILAAVLILVGLGFGLRTCVGERKVTNEEHAASVAGDTAQAAIQQEASHEAQAEILKPVQDQHNADARRADERVAEDRRHVADILAAPSTPAGAPPADHQDTPDRGRDADLIKALYLQISDLEAALAARDVQIADRDERFRLEELALTDAKAAIKGLQDMVGHLQAALATSKTLQQGHWGFGAVIRSDGAKGGTVQYDWTAVSAGIDVTKRVLANGNSQWETTARIVVRLP
jgi:hypothetical protein